MDKTIKTLHGKNFTYKRNRDYFNILVSERKKEIDAKAQNGA
jgi:hypothetical protein